MKKIFSSTVYQFVGKGITSFLGVLITILLTRYLGPKGFGEYSFAIVFVTMFGVIGDWGMTLIGVREISRKNDSAGSILGNILVIRLFLSALALVVSNVLIRAFPYSDMVRILVSVYSLVLVAISIKTSFQIIFNAKLRMELIALSEISANLISFLFIAGMVYFKLSIISITFGFVVGQFVAAMVAVFFGLKLTRLKLTNFFNDSRFILMESLPMGAILVLFTIYNRVDTLILNYFSGEISVGYYVAAYRIFEVLVLGAAYFANSILPLISRLAIEDKLTLGKVYTKAFIFLLSMGCFVAVLNFLFAPIGIMIIGGKDFSPAVSALRILSLSLVVSYLNHLNGYTLIALGKQWWSFGIACAALFLNLVFNFWLIPLFSFQAAAFITFVTEFFIVCMSVYVISKNIKIKFNLEDFRYSELKNLTKKLVN